MKYLENIKNEKVLSLILERHHILDSMKLVSDCDFTDYPEERPDFSSLLLINEDSYLKVLKKMLKNQNEEV